jgi:tetratricopeptide (TPR) repeat protein
VLVTSRTPVEGLDGAHLLPLAMMTDADATELLTRIVGADRVSAEPEAARELVRVCGTLPLAVRIAGTKLAARPSWPLSLLARRITGAHARLSELESGNLSVRASIESSYVTLPERSRRAFCLLALLGPADFAGWVVGVLIGEPDGDDVIGDLESRSLVTVLGADATGEPRYRLHDLVRDFAAERLDEDMGGERHESLGRLLDAWLQLVVTADARLPAEPFFPPPPARPAPAVVPPAVAERLTADPVAWLSAERVNLLAAVEQACGADRVDVASKLASHQCAFQYLQYRPDDAERMWRKVAGYAAAAADHATAHSARLRVATSMVLSGQASNAIDILDRCIENLEQGPDSETLAIALSWRAHCAWDLDNFGLALTDATRGAVLARQARSGLAEHRNLGFLGLTLARLGRPDEAVAVSEQGLAVASALHEPLYEIESLGNHAFTCTLSGRHDRAIEVCQRGIELSRRVHDIGMEALFGGVLGDAYYATGRFTEAVDTWRGSLTVFRDHGSQRFHAVCLLKLGYAHQAMGSAEAVGYLAESLRMFRQMDLPRYVERAEQALENSRAQ